MIFESLTRVGLSFVLGTIIGIEREYKEKPAGLKTHVLICVGSAILTDLSAHFSVGGDPGRIAAQIVSGIGFIGAGTILQSRQVVQGLTTAATLWVTASVGMMAGSGYLLLATLFTILIEVFMALSNLLTKKKYDKRHFSLAMEIKKTKVLEKIDTIFQVFKVELKNKTLSRQKTVMLELNYKTSPLRHHLIMKQLLKLKGIGKFYKI